MCERENDRGDDTSWFRNGLKLMDIEQYDPSRGFSTRTFHTPKRAANYATRSRICLAGLKVGASINLPNSVDLPTFQNTKGIGLSLEVFPEIAILVVKNLVTDPAGIMPSAFISVALGIVHSRSVGFEKLHVHSVPVALNSVSGKKRFGFGGGQFIAFSETWNCYDAGGNEANKESSEKQWNTPLVNGLRMTQISKSRFPTGLRSAHGFSTVPFFKGNEGSQNHACVPT